MLTSEKTKSVILRNPLHQKKNIELDEVFLQKSIPQKGVRILHCMDQRSWNMPKIFHWELKLTTAYHYCYSWFTKFKKTLWYKANESMKKQDISWSDQSSL